MQKVITLSGMHQKGTLKGWDKCDPVDAKDSKGKDIVRCAGGEATLSGAAPACKPTWKKTKRGRRCVCGNRFVKSAACKREK